MKKVIKVTMGRLHNEMIGALVPFYGKNDAEVLKNIAIRWMEEHIGSESMKKLDELGVIKGFKVKGQK